MKKLLAASAIALFGLSNAQIAKGTTYLSGQVNYSQTEDNNDDSKIEELRLVPTIGYFVAPNIAIGTGIGFQSRKETEVFTQNFGGTTITNTNKGTVSAFVVSPFVRKYWNLGDKLFIFGQLEVPLEFGKFEGETTSVATFNNSTTSQTNSNSVNYSSVGVNVKPGLDYFLNKNWTIEATIGEFGYRTSKIDIDGAENVNDFNFGLNFSNVMIGVKYVFAK